MNGAEGVGQAFRDVEDCGIEARPLDPRLG